MTFTIEVAKKTVAHYSYLIGEPMDATKNNIPITHIAILPADRANVGKCLAILYNGGDNDSALLASGFDKSSVEIFFMSKQTVPMPVFIKKELDEILTRKNIEKVYLNNTWLSK
jgi:hypothetical protein